MIATESITKTFGDLKAVSDVSLNVKKGSIYGLLGSNGAGKSTLLKILAGIYRADHGEAIVDGKPVFETPETKGRTLFISDYPYFFNQTSLDDMARFYRGVYPHWNEKRYTQLSAHFEIDQSQKLNRFSKGMQRLAAMILTISAMPDVLILDEPFDGLDPVVRHQMKNILLQEVADRSLTLMVSSHNLREMEDFCDYVGVMHQGEILFEKDLDDLKSDVHKIQLAFKQAPGHDALTDQLDLLHHEQRGSMQMLIVKGNKEAIIDHIKQFDPVIVDVLPLTLEEVFHYEMGGAGYEIRNLIIE
ncbi:ABC transporter ATP-binding protein [Salisediminibacterium beveridgei]|uniref:ABC transporter, ATP-binding protein n=1 Tax=Salisediminibacterium beveridgei TaxID=632773 RepID=A0A1D7QRA9_9BACI|nr:ABC transporter ATP-binding protein [Salisediminibacterium beveridgei]AOM81537.1 ABC transporter, ATP-binding protein [Salisediminibacterium beveridgei]